MTVEELREKGWIVYECIAGSHAYGTNIEGSDVDIRGVFIQPTEEVLAGRYIEQVSDKLNDITFYEIGRFLSLLCGGNPNILDILGTPEDCIVFESPLWEKYFPKHLRHQYLTKKLKGSFVGYAHTQIKKAKGLRKKINWDMTKVVRKDVLDFCYVLESKEESLRFKKWAEISGFEQEDISLAKVNNFPNVYAMYIVDGKMGGIISENSNEVRTRSISKNAPFIKYLRFAKDSYSTHCKDYREYAEWIEKRNPQRYKDNLKGEQGYDHKNMMHCMRLLMTAKDIAEKKSLVIKRPERDYLLSIRNGEIKYDKLLEDADSLVDEIAEAFENSTLEKEISRTHQENLILKIRKDGL